MTTLLLRRLASVALVLTLALGIATAQGASHVRVVLDTSRSMSGPPGPNDPGRLAVLATMLLYDLVDPNPLEMIAENKDSFFVMPFGKNWPKVTNANLPLPTYDPDTTISATGPQTSDRQAFWEQLNSLAYDAPWTYFSPGLQGALDSLATGPTGANDRRVVVLVTDGLPDDFAARRDKDKLLVLAEEMRARKIEFYVLAFGPIANRAVAFFSELFRSQNEALRHVLPDPSGQNLVINMADIFSRSFGYMVDLNVPRGRLRPLDLDGGVTPLRVGVVAYRRNGLEPSQEITDTTTNDLFIASRGLMKAHTVGAGYSVQMFGAVLANQQGQPRYRLATNTEDADVAILRQIRPRLRPLGVVDSDSGQLATANVSPVIAVVADTPFVLRVMAQSPAGIAGSQAALDISFVRHGAPKAGCANPPRYAWEKIRDNANPNSRQRFGAGETYDLHMSFESDPAAPGQVYRGFIDVSAKYNGTEVDKLFCDSAQKVDVYPKIAIRTDPPARSFNPAILRKAQRRCVSFELKMEDAEKPKLAVLGTPIRLRALVKPSDPGLPGGALAGATFTLDGEPIGYQGEDTPWNAGRALEQTGLLRTHEFCITLGDPLISEPTPDFGLTLDLRLDHTPYNDFRVIEPFEAKLRVAPVHTLAQHFTWDPLWALLWPLLAALAALALAAPRFALPPDLGYHLSAESESGSADTEGNGQPPAPLLPLTPPTWWQRLLGLSPPRALRDPDSDRIIAWIKPLDQALYGLKPAVGIGVREPGGVALDQERGVAQIEVHHDYLLHGNAGRWRLRMGYGPTPAAKTAGRPDAAAAPGRRHLLTQR